MRPLVDAGHLYLGLSPLYRIKIGSGTKEETHWVYTDAEKEQVLSKKGKSSKLHITRFKGLGEMNPETLWDTTLNPKTRNLLRITVDKQIDPDALLESLLGKDAGARYKLIQENSHRLELDL
jgi:DNA gyrase subunit B